MCQEVSVVSFEARVKTLLRGNILTICSRRQNLKYCDNLFSEAEVMLFVQECDDTSLSLSSATMPTRLQNCHPPRQPD